MKGVHGPMSSANSADDDPLARPFDRLSRYDLVLAVVPLGFVLAALVGRILALSASGTLVLGSAVGLVAVVDALFLSPPTGRSGGS
jgi:hypothetical protein